MPASLRVGIVGHRTLGTAAAARFVLRECSRILRERVDAGDSPVALSALARGADTIFAEAALELGIPLEVVIPFERYSVDFPPGKARARYDRLRGAARAEHRLPFSTRSIRAYVVAMRWVVRRSDLLVAVWDGRPGRGPGGTADAVFRAARAGGSWIHVDVARRQVECHLARGTSGRRSAVCV
jgi:hypothetical protein